MAVTFFQKFSTITKECEIKFYFLICTRLNICKIITLYYDWTIYFYILNNSIRMKIELSLLFSLQFYCINNYKNKRKIMQDCILLYLFTICTSSVCLP